MENSTTTTSVTPPKATLTSVTSKELVIRNENRSVLQHSYDLGQNLDQSSSLQLHDNQHNYLSQYQQPLRNFRSQTGLPNPFPEINEHGYNLPLEQTSSAPLYYGAYDSHDVSTIPSLPHSSVSNHQFMHPLPPNALEIEDSFSLSKSSQELSEECDMKDFKISHDSFQKANSYHEERPGKTFNQAKNVMKRPQMINKSVSIQLPGIETFSSSSASPLLISSKIVSNESIPVTLTTASTNNPAITLETPLIGGNLMPIKPTSINSKIPYPVMKEDISFLISNNLETSEPTAGESETHTEGSSVMSNPNSNIQHNTYINTLPQYPCAPSPNDCNTFPILQPTLPINYRPLLENLRPIRRTEEIVRLKNDGGKITIVETTDDPGKSN